jgi:hypothetical protein
MGRAAQWMQPSKFVHPFGLSLFEDRKTSRQVYNSCACRRDFQTSCCTVLMCTTESARYRTRYCTAREQEQQMTSMAPHNISNSGQHGLGKCGITPHVQPWQRDVLRNLTSEQHSITPKHGLPSKRMRRSMLFEQAASNTRWYHHSVAECMAAAAPVKRKAVAKPLQLERGMCKCNSTGICRV